MVFTDYQYQLLLFDLDNTLLDHDSSEEHSLRRACGKHDIVLSPSMLATYREIDRALWRDLANGLRSVAEIAPESFAALCRRLTLPVAPQLLMQDYQAEYSRSIHVMPGALETLSTLSSQFRIVVTTNGSQLQATRVCYSPLSVYVSSVLTSADLGVSKPNRKFFDSALTRLGFTDRRKVLIIGDSLYSDIIGGHNAGIDTCWLNPTSVQAPGHLRPTHEIRFLPELVSILLI